ncbi:hypothetical protein OH76DRAFT_1510371 [Lentinus brumalis]|uniref:Integrase core domain-containing protein n=1 Tax=Lentinus brumalis TaxID=2498619 RepID=A0A371DVV2_9APHY|nr:hypothetical protein OH76DRAFT_1510371 [Polyporus brumalis]
MEEHRGLNRGSYIWGRSVHNTRIERLWYDVTSGYGGKWKVFFLELENSYGLDADRADHIWLLHHLFLAALNQDAQEWAEAWNAHRIHIRGERAASPRELFMFGMVRNGSRGIYYTPPADDGISVDDLANYGVDWDALADRTLLRHHLEHNPGEEAPGTSEPTASTTVPSRLSHVPCDEPDCPLSPEQIRMLDAYLAHHFDLSTRDMMVRRHIWMAALDFYTRLFS